MDYPCNVQWADDADIPYAVQGSDQGTSDVC